MTRSLITRANLVERFETRLRAESVALGRRRLATHLAAGPGDVIRAWSE